MRHEWQDFSYQDQLRHTGSTEQLNRIRRLRVAEGPADGVPLIEVQTGAGLRAVFVESRALDLFELTYRGYNIGFISKNSLQSGRVSEVPGMFPEHWPAGMLATCGLRNTGDESTERAEAGAGFHPAHGKLQGMAAEQVCCRIDPDAGVARISGIIRESALFGHHLQMTREITIDLKTATIDWQDTVRNLSAEPEPVFLLYHVNFGYPFLHPELQLYFPPGEVIPRTEFARRGLAEFDQITAPQDGLEEQVFFHHADPKLLPEDGWARVRLVRPKLRLTAEVAWPLAELPILIQWKSMKSGDYALGIEPSTSVIRGRAEELAHGYDWVLEPFAAKTFHLRLTLRDLD